MEVIGGYHGVHMRQWKWQIDVECKRGNGDGVGEAQENLQGLDEVR